MSDSTLRMYLLLAAVFGPIIVGWFLAWRRGWLGRYLAALSVAMVVFVFVTNGPATGAVFAAAVVIGWIWWMDGRER